MTRPHSRTFRQKITPAAHVLARVGCVSIGTLYVLIGVWAMLALLGVANPAADEQRILHRILQFPLGGALIGAVALGTSGYIVWLIFEAVVDPYGLGKTPKGVAERIGIAMSTIAYGVIVVAASKVLFAGQASSEREKQRFVATVLNWPAGPWLIGAGGVVIAVAGLYQLKYVYDGDHQRRLLMDQHGKVARTLVNILGWAGYGARCAILLVVGGFMVQAAVSFDPRKVGDTDSAFDVLGLGGGSAGNILFSAVALGTIAYGIVMYINALYFDFGEE